MASLDHEAPGATRRRSDRGWSRLAFVLLFCVLTGVAILVRGEDDERLPPDLRLDWILGSQASREAPPLSGKAGETVAVTIRIRNIGGSDAFAVNLDGRTALGRLGRPRRFQPGPAAGSSRRHEQALTLAPGMRELCFEARLQVLSDREAAEQNLDDNQICRAIELRDASDEDPRSETPSFPGRPGSRKSG